MSDYQKIKITLAGRVYPLTVPREEEASVRQAARHIEESLRKFEEGYAVRDKQDLLAMSALQMASRLERSQNEELVDGRFIRQSLTALETKIQQALQ